jgi:hypothetical protein
MKFEYRVLSYGQHLGGFISLLSELDRLGAKGWELCGFEYGRAFLKRGTANESDGSPNRRAVSAEMQSAIDTEGI